MEPLVEPRWPPGLEFMKTIDDLLRCGICFEYFNIAMIIPQCSHNYCSLCIRKFLSYKTQCPTCCVAVTEPDLKNNRILDELVKSMSLARNRLLQFSLESPPLSPASSSWKKLPIKVSTPGVFRHPTNQGSRLMDSFLTREIGDSPSELSMKENDRQFSLQKETGFSPETDMAGFVEKMAPGSSDVHGPVMPSTSALKRDTKVDCPVCGVSISENHINKHLDTCLSREEKKESLRSSVQKRKPLPKTVYNLLSDRDLKKKLKQHGLSIQGNKQQLIKRHQEFVHMYNAQCDALHPKSAAEIAQELENMEKTRMRLEASKLNESMMVFTKDQTEREIDEIHSKYRKKHQNEFQLLVDQAKKGYKKRNWTSENKVMGKGQEDVAMNFSDTTLVTNHCLQSKPGSPGRSEAEGADDSSGCTDIQGATLFSSESDSCNSSSSDIIRDLLEEEEAWEASYKNDLQDREVSPRQNRRTRAAENAEIEPRNKRNRN
ncbi:E3 ubiquitin-protein ligase RAD18 [Perognathus longimembris pacificus]|uniref:E3 ubiquitin-protein ligase RAD18 n=1 Tax=Perognathus longimembris pacificus TaxID=214514 RepID=UPI00201841A2|nr:E3 ubiquitin-protein ligase RAD18 [Perognathus longimembris pacificus]